MLAALWRNPNLVEGEEVLVAEMDGRIVGCVTVEDRGGELELVNIDVPLQLQGKGIGTILVRSVEERARAEGKQAVTERFSSGDLAGLKDVDGLGELPGAPGAAA